MAEPVNIHEAKTHFSRLAAARRGRRGDPHRPRRAAPLHGSCRWRRGPEPRRPGQWRGRVRMAPDFDQTPADLLDAFEA